MDYDTALNQGGLGQKIGLQQTAAVLAVDSIGQRDFPPRQATISTLDGLEKKLLALAEQTIMLQAALATHEERLCGPAPVQNLAQGLTAGIEGPPHLVGKLHYAADDLGRTLAGCQQIATRLARV